MRCPYCRSSHNWKWNKLPWMTWTPGSIRNVRCSGCGHEFALWLGLFPMRHKTAHTLTTIWHWVLLFLLVLGLAWGVPALF